VFDDSRYHDYHANMGFELTESQEAAGGFPAELYRMRYPAPGAPGLAGRVQELLGDAGLACAVSPGRGLHRGWTWGSLSMAAYGFGSGV
jgi:aromatic ring-opening dioxygenase catalytic subunit (LigB family)